MMIIYIKYTYIYFVLLKYLNLIAIFQIKKKTARLELNEKLSMKDHTLIQHQSYNTYTCYYKY